LQTPHRVAGTVQHPQLVSGLADSYWLLGASGLDGHETPVVAKSTDKIFWLTTLDNIATNAALERLPRTRRKVAAEHRY
jgi:hypothetical protein